MNSLCEAEDLFRLVTVGPHFTGWGALSSFIAGFNYKRMSDFTFDTRFIVHVEVECIGNPLHLHSRCVFLQWSG